MFPTHLTMCGPIFVEVEDAAMKTRVNGVGCNRGWRAWSNGAQIPRPPALTTPPSSLAFAEDSADNAGQEAPACGMQRLMSSTEEAH